MIEKKLNKAKSSQVHIGIQNQMSGKIVTPKQRVKVRRLVKAHHPRKKLNLAPVTNKINIDPSSSKCPPLKP